MEREPMMVEQDRDANRPRSPGGDRHNQALADSIVSFAREHRVLVALLGATVVVILGPIVYASLLALGFTALLSSVVLSPALVLGFLVWACFSVGRRAYGAMLQAPVGSENRVMMKPEAHGNEAHGHLELNLIKVGSPENDADKTR